MSTINICLVGNSKVGKTTALLTYKNQAYTPSENATIGITRNFFQKENLNLIVNIPIPYIKDLRYSRTRTIQQSSQTTFPTVFLFHDILRSE